MRAFEPRYDADPNGSVVRVRGTVGGVRRWRPVSGSGGELLLGSLAVGDCWQRDGLTTWAQCHRRSGAHPPGLRAPVGACGCGLHASHPSASDLAAGDLAPSPTARSLEVAGIVEAWGTIHVHREGFRAQYARPTALFLIGTDRDSDYGQIVTDLAIGHRVRVVELDSPGAIGPWCREAAIGLGSAEIEALISGDDPADVSAV